MELINEKIVEFFKRKESFEFKYQYIPCKLDDALTTSILGNFFAQLSALEQLFDEWLFFIDDDKELQYELTWGMILSSCELSVKKSGKNIYTISLDFSDFDRVGDEDFAIFRYTLPTLSDIAEDDYLMRLVEQLEIYQNLKLPQNPEKRNRLQAEYASIVLQFNLISYCLITYNQIFNFNMESILFAIEPLVEINFFDNFPRPAFLKYYVGMAHFFKGDAGEGVKYLDYFISDMEIFEKIEWLSISFMFLFNFNEGIAIRKVDIYLLDKKLPDSYKYLMLTVLETIMLEANEAKLARQYAKKAEKLSFRDFDSALYQLAFHNSQNELDQAKSVLKRLEKLQPNNYDLLFLKSDILMKSSQFNEALLVFSKIDELKSNNALNYYRKAICYRDMKNVAKARECFDRSLKIADWIPEEGIIEFRNELQAIEDENNLVKYQQLEINLDDL